MLQERPRPSYTLPEYGSKQCPWPNRTDENGVRHRTRKLRHSREQALPTRFRSRVRRPHEPHQLLKVLRFRQDRLDPLLGGGSLFPGLADPLPGQKTQHSVDALCRDAVQCGADVVRLPPLDQGDDRYMAVLNPCRFDRSVKSAINCFMKPLQGQLVPTNG